MKVKQTTKMVRNIKKRQVSLLENKGTGKASVDATKSLPIAAIAFKPSANDLLLRLFEKLGTKKCLSCCTKVQTESLVLCQSNKQYLICRDCFLVGESDSIEESRYGASKEKNRNSTYYISVGSTSQVVNLEGKKYELECLFTQPMPI